MMMSETKAEMAWDTHRAGSAHLALGKVSPSPPSEHTVLFPPHRDDSRHLSLEKTSLESQIPPGPVTPPCAEMSLQLFPLPARQPVWLQALGADAGRRPAPPGALALLMQSLPGSQGEAEGRAPACPAIAHESWVG